MNGPDIVLRLPEDMRNHEMIPDNELAQEAQSFAQGKLGGRVDPRARTLLFNLVANLAFQKRLARVATRKMQENGLALGRVLQAADGALTDLQTLANLCDDPHVLEIVQHAAGLLLEIIPRGEGDQPKGGT